MCCRYTVLHLCDTFAVRRQNNSKQNLFERFELGSLQENKSDDYRGTSSSIFRFIKMYVIQMKTRVRTLRILYTCTIRARPVPLPLPLPCDLLELHARVSESNFISDFIKVNGYG